MRRLLPLILIPILLLASCNLPGSNTKSAQDLMSTIVAATFQAMTPQASPPPPATSTPQPPQATPTVGTGKISGGVCYHDGGMLELTLYFQNTATQQILTKIVDRPDTTYSIDLPAGTYKVFGWPPDYTIGVLVKGKSTVDLATGQKLAGVDFCDYSQGPFAVPYPPGFSPSTAHGSISGDIYGYPGSGRLTVVAFNKGTGYWFYVILLAGQSGYSISDLPAGRYQVVAYDGAGNTGGTQPNVYVIGGQNTSADIDTWGSGFPDNPVH